MRSEGTAEWPINEVAARTGTTSRTLRHYGDVGLLPPSRIGRNGYRYYDRRALIRLQRILLLRGLGLGLPAIRRVLDNETDVCAALESHVASLTGERERIGRQIESVRRTIAALREGRELGMSEMFDGFDYTQYREEVEQRWGKAAFAVSAAWWESKSAAERAEYQRSAAARARAWSELASTDASPDGAEAQEFASKHVSWLTSVPGTPAATADREALRRYVIGLAGMYVADERFAAHYGGAEKAAFVKAALEHYAETAL